MGRESPNFLPPGERDSPLGQELLSSPSWPLPPLPPPFPLSWRSHSGTMFPSIFSQYLLQPHLLSPSKPLLSSLLPSSNLLPFPPVSPPSSSPSSRQTTPPLPPLPPLPPSPPQTTAKDLTKTGCLGVISSTIPTLNFSTSE